MTIEEEIKELEEQWEEYHKDTRNKDMPDMLRLVKLRIERDRKNG